MSNAIKRLHDYLAKSPSVVYPQDVLEYLPAIEAENAKLREFVLTLAFCANDEADCDQCPMNGVRCDVVQQYFCDGAAETLRELGIEVDE